MSKYSFTPVTYRFSRLRFANEHDPRVKVTASGIYLPEPIYAELNRPERTIIAVDEENNAFKVETTKYGYLTRKNMYKDGRANYQILVAAPNKDRDIHYYIGKLPIGLYKSIGGGIFEYDPSGK